MNLCASSFSLFLALAVCASAAEPAPATISGPELASRLLAKQQDGSSYIRLKMDIAEGAKGALQLQIKSRATRGSTELVYQVLFPKERKGETVLLRKSSGRVSGTLFTPPDSVRPLTASQLREPLFGSDLTYEDVIDSFFAWDQQTIVGNEVIDRVECIILESKSKKGESSYSSVRSWVDLRRLVPMRVEKYSGAGRLARRIDTTRVVNDDKGRPIPANLTIRGTGGSTTELDGSRIKHDVTYADAEFTPEGLKITTIPKANPE